MGIIPIDVNQPKHLWVALLVFSITGAASGVIFACFVNNRVDFPVLYVVVIIEFVLAAGYIVTYITNYRYAPVFQKSCIMFTAIAFYLYLRYLTGILWNVNNFSRCSQDQ